MNMMPLSQNYRPQYSPSRHVQQADEMLNAMLKQTDKGALMAKLSSGFFSQNTLHSLLYNAFLTESADVVAMMLTTKSYAFDVVANIIVEALNNEQGVNEQERFVAELLKDDPSKVSVLTTALHIAARRGMDLNNDRALIGKLIKLSADVLSSDEAAQVAHACSDIGEFFLFVHLDRKNFEALSINCNVINEIEVTKEVAQPEMKLLPSTFATIPPKLTFTFSPEIKIIQFLKMPEELLLRIGQFLNFLDLLELSQTSWGLNKVMHKALPDHTTSIKTSELTEAAMVTLRKVHCLDLSVDDVTDAKMEQIGQLTNLRALHLKKGSVTDDGLQHLEKLTHLHTLSLINLNKGSGIGLHCLEKLTDLHTLDLKETRVNGTGLQPLEKLSHLRNLKLMCTGVEDDDLSYLKNLAHLHTLNLYCSKLTDAGLQHLEKLIHLHTLDLTGTEVTDAGLHHLEKLIHLHTLDLHRTKVTDAGLHHLASLTNLHTLNLQSTNVSGAGLQHLKELTNLNTLNLYATKVTDAGLQHLEELTNLNTLILYATKVTDAGLHHLEKLTQLHTLNLRQTGVTDAGLHHLEKLTNLHYLGLDGTQVTDAGLIHLEKLTDLHYLSLGATKVSNNGLQHLASLTNLRTLELSGTKVTQGRRLYLQTILPNLKRLAL